MNNRHARIFDSIGWVGTALIIGGYGIFATGIVPEATLYHILNCIGSLCMVVLTYYRRIWQAVVINSSFALFALIAIGRNYL